jgi:hypothetical protein
VTTGGIVQQEYARRVNDAKIIVDQFLSQFVAHDDLWSSICGALEYYVSASSAWGAHIAKSGYEHVGTDSAGYTCRYVDEYVKRQPDLGAGHLPVGIGRGIKIAVGAVPLFWRCASEKLEAAEQIVVNQTN